jgi:phage-related protein
MELIFSHSKIDAFISQLDNATASRVYKILSKLENCGNEIRMPDSKSLGGGLFELRVLGAKQIRILYVFHNKQGLILHIFEKKTWLIPKREIEYARNILKMYIA